MKDFFLLITIILLTINIYSEDSNKKNKFNYTARSFFRIPSLQTSISNDNREYEIRYYPNVNVQVGLGGSINNWGTSLSINIPKPQDELLKYGKTDYFDFQLYYTNKHFGLDFLLQTYSGFYLEEKEEEKVLDIRSDLNLNKLGLNFFYIFDDDFSLRAAFEQNGEQKKSSASFMLLSGLEFFSLKGDKNLINKDFQEESKKEFIYYGGQYYTFSIAPGYGYTTNNDGFFFTSMLFMGIGLQYRKSLLEKTSTEFGLSIKFNARLSIGYNAKQFYTGLYFVLDHNSTTLEKISVQGYSSTVEFFWAYRF